MPGRTDEATGRRDGGTVGRWERGTRARERAPDEGERASERASEPWETTRSNDRGREEDAPGLIDLID